MKVALDAYFRVLFPSTSAVRAVLLFMALLANRTAFRLHETGHGSLQVSQCESQEPLHSRI